MTYTFREEQQEFTVRGKKISDTTIVVTFYVEALDHFYQVLQTFQKSVQLIFNEGILIGYEVRYAKTDKETIFNMLKSEEIIRLDECFIEDFSLKEYAEYCETSLDNYELGKLNFPNKFSAKLSFWEGKTNFSKMKFGFVDFSFYGAFFGGTEADFSCMEILDGFFDFNRLYVNADVYFTFSFTKIEKGDIFLNYAYFEEGDKDFISLFLNSGNLCLTNMSAHGGKLDFSYSEIQGNLLLNKAYCKNNSLIMISSKFHGLDCSLSEFRNCEFRMFETSISDNIKNFTEMYMENSLLCFENSEFISGEADFKYFEAQNSNLMFLNMKFFTETLDFSYIVCSGMIDFSKSKFGSTLILFTDSILDVVSFNNTESQGMINFRVQQCRFLSLKNMFIGDVFDITSNVQFKYFQLSYVALTGRIILDWHKNNINNAIKNVYAEEHKRIRDNMLPNFQKIKLKELRFITAEIFKTLKENFNVLRRYNDEDDAYIAYRQALREYKNYGAGPLEKFKLFLEWLLLDKLGGYGTDPWRTWIGIVFSWLVFAGLYYYFDEFYIGESTDMTKLGRSLYHSAITFFTIGYGDIIPKGAFMRALSGIEGFFGVIFTSYFMVAFTRKTLR
ncbi:MAG: potassium channel family protein [Brevinemataceae bacterium]